MITKEQLKKCWIEQVSRSNNNADKVLVEKVCYAFLLLEGLALSSLQFIFKGGTSLMLHFNSTKRLSIDIDILMECEPDNLGEQLCDIAHRQGFLRAVPQNRNVNSKINKVHYRFFYKSNLFPIDREETVLLDIVFDSNPYQRIERKEILSPFLPSDSSPATVLVPSIEDLLGDKLTAFAPNTTGVPFFKSGNSMSMEILKQLFDIGCLFNASSDIAIIKQSFSQVAHTELKYREVEGGLDVILQDIINTALCISTRGAIGVGDFGELQSGIKRVSCFIFSEPFHIERATIAAAKAAYRAALIKHGCCQIEKYHGEDVPKIESFKLSKLNKLQKTNPEAYYYWFLFSQLEI